MNRRLTEILPIVIFTVLYVLGFATVFFTQQNFEFVMYLVVLLILASIVSYTYLRGVAYTKITLWLLSVFGLLHFLGGTSFTEGDIVYNLILIDLIAEPYSILKYDQAVHAFGFFTTTFVAYDVLKTNLKENFSSAAVLFSIVFVSAGLGALNEIVEFSATLLLQNVHVGGYENTALDLVFNLSGALCAAVVISCTKLSRKKAGMQ